MPKARTRIESHTKYRPVAEKIVEQLFTNGFGHKARRLVMEDETRPFDEETNRRSAGGWCRDAAIEQVEIALIAAKMEL